MLGKSTPLAENDRQNKRGNARSRMHHDAARKILYPHVLQPAATPNPVSHWRVNHKAENSMIAPNFIRSTTAPTYKPGVMMAKVI